jgi:hypothetical protein
VSAVEIEPAYAVLVVPVTGNSFLPSFNRVSSLNFTQPFPIYSWILKFRQILWSMFYSIYGFSLLTRSSKAMCSRAQGDGGMWKKDQHSHFFFRRSG